jgi:hypothetical protein
MLDAFRYGLLEVLEVLLIFWVAEAVKAFGKQPAINEMLDAFRYGLLEAFEGLLIFCVAEAVKAFGNAASNQRNA